MKVFDRLFGGAIDRRIAAYQNDLITKHCAEVEEIYRQMRGWRHDYHNHIQAMLAMSEDSDRLKEYLWELNQDLTRVDTVIKTGNVMADAILNSKIALIKARRIKIDAKASVPQKLPFSDVDLCVIIGNLLDNAMEACERQRPDSERFIRVYVGVMKKQLYISVMNSTDVKERVKGTGFLSSKKGKDHGFGLIRVDHIAQKNGGYVNRQNEPGVFATEVMLPL